jgi:Zinc dependent phospholipase C
VAFGGNPGMARTQFKFAWNSKAAGRSLRTAFFFLLFLFTLCLARPCRAYSVLTHEEIVDLLWQDQIQPLLKNRFPAATEEDLRKAHAFAYGGCVVQDMGYYPFGSKYFSDLVHYVRSGDFVVALIEQSSDLNEYAFALGALSHYAADNSGHPTINRVVAIEFPSLGRKYGEQVRYADDPKSHIRTEFGFDMVQVAKNRYTSDRYHDFIGFSVSKDLLDRAFFMTYTLRLNDVFGDPDLAIGTFRRAISAVIPEMTRVALLARRQEIVADTPNFNQKKFLYYLSRKGYEKEWGTQYRKPGAGTKILAFFLRLVPKVGPFRALSFKIPTTRTEDMYIKSVDLTVENYRTLLRESKDDKLQLANKDFDTGRDTRAGEYQLTDKGYEKLLDQLAKRNFDHLTPQLQENLLEFYADLNAPIWTKRSKKAWTQTLAEIEKLRSAPSSPAQPAKTSEAEDRTWVVH